MQHLLAYGNSDQVSFRTSEVRASFDLMTVPGTIASYYQEATAGFVLSSQIDYLIDPRTPLFQNAPDTPRASHLTLADWHGPRVKAALESGVDMGDPTFWSPEIVDEMVVEVIARQRGYADSAPLIRPKLDRYARLLADALADQGEPAPGRQARSPAIVLAPYFAVSGPSDPWWPIMLRIWDACSRLDDPETIVPVLCVDGRPKENADGAQTLATLLPLIPPGLSQQCYFWITNFDERKVSEAQLRSLWQVVANRPAGRTLVNLYGGFFSICMRHAGLFGFGNGLTYSESRDWPALASTGAAPPRYYVRELHAFLPPALAANLAAFDSFFECDCSACAAWRADGQTIASLPYHDLKRHFALARSWELALTADQALSDVSESLLAAKARADYARSESLVLRAMPQTEFLNRWAAVLSDY